MKKNHAGFTLIELIAVIVILGILTATALPKFADLTSDARVAKLNAAVGAMKSAVSITHGKFLINPVSPQNFEDVEVTFVNGYPSAENIAAVAGLSTLDYLITNGATVTTVSVRANCTATYTEAASAVQVPVIVITDITNC